MRWLTLLPLILLLSLFALSNMEAVELRLWPFDLAWVAPLGVAVLVLCALAFLLGAFLAWTANFGARRRSREVETAAKLLDAELAGMKQQEAEAQRAANLGRLSAPVA